ncbi:secretin N-terminal domain-containing protein [Pseudomonas sp. RIT-PI-S]|uniref:secretin N-terminal domain-containing protein n=1 Tax=Pseudomonas sp. RIT-PI-S TaxID=3035295 RepID=UPI0021D93A90|nr:secretin N-terminal domain-containing protein [Pseudomonas sp. RIT-PI-S]
MPLRPFFLLLLIAFTPFAQAATQVLDLHYRSSEELLPMVRSFLGSQGTVSAFGNQLVVNAEPGKLDELGALLERLDTPARRLLISVDTSDSNHSSGAGAGNGRVIRYGTANRSGGVQQVQASEGTPALIQVGQSVPLTTAQTDAYGRLQTQTEYRNVTQGFYVTASVTGETVHLAISTNNDHMSQERPDVVNVQSTDTRVSGPLGQWITVAGISGQSQGERSGGTRYYGTQGHDDMTLKVRVDALP